MTKTTEIAPFAPASRGAFAKTKFASWAPQITFGPDEDAAAAAAAAAEAAAAEAKAAEEAAAAEAAEAAAAEEAEAARKAAEEEAKKNMTAAEREKHDLLREVMEKKNKLKEETAERERLAAELKKYEGLDIDKVKSLIEAEKNREKEELERKGEFDRLKQMIAEERAAEKAAFEEQIEAMKSEKAVLLGQVDTLTIGQSFSSSSFINEDLVLTPTKARALYGSHFEMKDGKIVAYDKPAGTAGRTMLPGADGEPLSFDAALKKIIEADPEKDTLLKAKGKFGAHSATLPTKPNATTPKADKLFGVGRIRAALDAENAQ